MITLCSALPKPPQPRVRKISRSASAETRIRTSSSSSGLRNGMATRSRRNTETDATDCEFEPALSTTTSFDGSLNIYKNELSNVTTPLLTPSEEAKVLETLLIASEKERNRTVVRQKLFLHGLKRTASAQCEMRASPAKHHRQMSCEGQVQGHKRPVLSMRSDTLRSTYEPPRNSMTAGPSNPPVGNSSTATTSTSRRETGNHRKLSHSSNVCGFSSNSLLHPNHGVPSQQQQATVAPNTNSTGSNSNNITTNNKLNDSGNAERLSHGKKITKSICSLLCSTFVQKTFCGLIMMSLVTFSWVGATHFLKASYTGLHLKLLNEPHRKQNTSGNESFVSDALHPSGNNSTLGEDSYIYAYDAPLFSTWFCSLGTILFLPLYLVCHALSAYVEKIVTVMRSKSTGKTGNGNNGVATNNNNSSSHELHGSASRRSNPRTNVGVVPEKNQNLGASATLAESIRGFGEKGFTFSKFLGRCCLFSLLWVLTNYLYIYSLRVLGCTEVMALFATNVCFIYLLSWVVLHEQFVGIRIVAVILGNTGIALLAYMDGINQTPTLGGVVLAAAAAAGSAIYRVLFKRVIGVVSFCQVAIFFSMIGLCSTLMFWPLMLTFALTGIETLEWKSLPWIPLLGALSLSLASNLMANFGILVTYETFITLGLLLAVPACAMLDIMWYEATFTGMKLAGIIMVTCGFLIVLFPSNWPDGITKLIRISRNRRTQRGEMSRKSAPDLRTGHLGSRLRSPSGRVK